MTSSGIHPTTDSKTSCNSTSAIATCRRSNRTKKRNCFSNDGTGISFIDDSHFEELLRQHEENGVRQREENQNKKRRLKSSSSFINNIIDGDETQPPDPIPLDHLPSPCIERIIEMLPSPRDVFSLVFLNKSILSHVTLEIVVKSAVNIQHDENKKSISHSRKMMQYIYDLVENRSIYIPSVLRLLRLVNAKWCERGKECWGYNIKTLRSCKLKDHDRSIYQAFGLSLCGNCIKGSTVPVPGFSSSFAWQEPRVPTLSVWSNLLPSNTSIDPNGNIGPVIHASHIFQIITTYGSNSEESKKAFERLITKLYGEESSDKRQQYEVKASNLVKIYERAEKDVDDYYIAKQNKDDAEQAARYNLRQSRKGENFRSIYNKLQPLLAGAPNADLALERYPWRNQDDLDCLEFKHTFASNATQRLREAPSSATNKTISSAALRIRKNLETIEANERFFKFSFLHGCATASRMERKLKDYCIKKFHTTSSILTLQGADERFFESIEQGKLWVALLRVLRSNGRHTLSTVVSQIVIPSNHNNSAEFRCLARSCWKQFEKNGRVPTNFQTHWDMNDLKVALVACKLEVVQLIKNAKDYLKHPDVVSFVVNGDNGTRSFTRRRAISQVFTPKLENLIFRDSQGTFVNIIPYETLMSRSFEQLLQVHMLYYRRGSSFHPTGFAGRV